MAKRVRKQRMRRSYLKRWSASVIPGHSSDPKAEGPRMLAYARLAYKDRVNSGVTEMNANGFARMFGLDLGQGGPERMKIVQRLLGFNAQEGYVLEKNLSLVNTKMRRLAIITNTRDESCYFICSEFLGRRLRRSKIYCARTVAMFAYNKDPDLLTGVTWVMENFANEVGPTSPVPRR